MKIYTMLNSYYVHYDSINLNPPILLMDILSYPSRAAVSIRELFSPNNYMFSVQCPADCHFNGLIWLVMLVIFHVGVSENYKDFSL